MKAEKQKRERPRVDVALMRRADAALLPGVTIKRGRGRWARVNRKVSP